MTSDNIMQLIIAVVGSSLASSGFWAFLSTKNKKRVAYNKLMMGSAYDKIATVGVAYIERGWITRDEYEELHNFYYVPYRDLGGNGVAERIMNEVNKLPFVHQSKYAGVLPAKPIEEPTNVRIHVAPPVAPE